MGVRPIPLRVHGDYATGDQVNALIAGVNGDGTVAGRWTGVDDDTDYGWDVQNVGAGGLSFRARSGDNSKSFVLQNSGTSFAGGLTVAGGLVVSTGGLSVLAGGASITGGLTVTSGGAAITGNSTVTGTLLVTSTLTVSSGGAAITGNSTITGTLLVTSTLTTQGSLAAGDANADTHTVIGVTTFRNAANTATQLFVDAGNNRVIVGSGTALGSDTTPNLQVVGRLYVAPESANDTALQIRRSSGATTGWTIGVENSPVNLAFKDDSDTKIFTIGDAGATYQAVVTGDFNVSDNAVIGGDLSASRILAGNTTFPSGTYALAIDGDIRMDNYTSVGVATAATHQYYLKVSFGGTLLGIPLYTFP